MGGTSVTPEMLANARDESLRKITYRMREKDKDATASPAALGIARQNRPPRSHRKHRLEHTVWENDLPHVDAESQPGNKIAAGNWSTNNSSSIPQVIPKDTVDESLGPDSALRATKADRKQPKFSGKKEKQPLHVEASGLEDVPTRLEPKKLEDSRWALKADLQPIKVDLDYNSNAWGSEIPSDASQSSGDSLQLMHIGKVARRAPEEPGQGLIGWDGKMAPPPVDWQDRPRFSNNDHPEFRDATARWATDVEEWRCDDAYGTAIPVELVKNIEWHPDGIGMVKRTFTINTTSAKATYGYEDTAADAAKYSQPVTEKDFESLGNLDPKKQVNQTFRNETTGELIKAWITNTKTRRKLEEAELQMQQAAKADMPEYKAAPITNRPTVNIYVRPAVKVDADQMLDIYNWYVEHSVRPPEMRPVDIDNMLYRLSECQSSKLPFIVAIMKNKTSASRIDRTAEIEAWEASPHPIKNVDPSAGVITTREKIVGWASASDFTAPDFVERIATELEIYVDPSYRQKGIGRCLMDKMLEILDRGYLKHGGYPFHCAPEARPMHGSGGARDIHKILFTLRKWKHPKDLDGLPLRNSGGGANKDAEKYDDRENDYELWLRKWLESWGFHVEGVLSGVGAKNGRFLDTVFLGRETSWQPMDGQIPTPLPGTF